MNTIGLNSIVIGINSGGLSGLGGPSGVSVGVNVKHEGGGFSNGINDCMQLALDYAQNKVSKNSGQLSTPAWRGMAFDES